MTDDQDGDPLPDLEGVPRQLPPTDQAKSLSRAANQRIQPVDPRTFTALLEQLQEGYVAAVAATAGCSMEAVSRDIWGFDAWLIRPPAQIGEAEETMLAVQLKNTTTIKPNPTKAHFSYQFKERKYFDALAIPRKNVKALALIMASPPAQAVWTESNHEYLSVSHCCYWANLENYPAAVDTKQPTVRVPTANIFNAAALGSMMDNLEREGALS